MKTLKHKQMLRQKRIWRIRKKVVGSIDRPRLCVSFTNKHVYAQAIDDTTGNTLVQVSSLGKELKGENLSANRESAIRLGKAFAEKAKAANITTVVFDRHGRPYHGRVKEFAEAVREGGIQF
ncbi:MAG TPA: 50S ribosomal protein L18 [Oceanipulchritudo sp.]|nr:50S ribosomal protein L18 [Oceanipulchritudo sp.]